jgi:hypothetical protein
MPRWVQAGLIWVLLANILDLWITLRALNTGMLDEGNPVMRHLLDTSPVLATAVKLGVVAAALIILARGYSRRPRHVAQGVAILSGVMVLLLAWNVYSWYQT